MSEQDNLELVLSYLSTKEDYALVGENAVAALVPDWYPLKTPFEIVGDGSHQDIHRIQLPIPIGEEVVIAGAQPHTVPYKGNNYSLRVARPEIVIAMNLVDNARCRRDAVRLISHLGSVINTEEVRNLLKGTSDYEKLYPIFTTALYELAR